MAKTRIYTDSNESQNYSFLVLESCHSGADNNTSAAFYLLKVGYYGNHVNGQLVSSIMTGGNIVNTSFYAQDGYVWIKNDYVINKRFFIIGTL